VCLVERRASEAGLERVKKIISTADMEFAELAATEITSDEEDAGANDGAAHPHPGKNDPRDETKPMSAVASQTTHTEDVAVDDGARRSVASQTSSVSRPLLVCADPAWVLEFSDMQSLVSLVTQEEKRINPSQGLACPVRNCTWKSPSPISLAAHLLQAHNSSQVRGRGD
jgi:hypothetical protein